MKLKYRNDIVSEARKYLNVPWRHQGRNAAGLDCCGLIIRVANDLGLADYDIAAYSRRTTGEQFLHHFLDAGMAEVPVSGRLPGDVLITEDRTFPCHCGFVTLRHGYEFFLHAYAGKRKVIEQELDPWLHKAVTVLRFPGLY